MRGMRRSDLGGRPLSSLEETRLEALPVAVPVTEVAQPLRAHARTLRLPSRLTRGVVWFGRVSAVWLPVYGLLGAKGHSFFGGVGISLLVASAWLGALRVAFIGARLALPARRLISCVIGSAGGLVLASALGLWLSDLGLHTWALVEAAGCILLLATGWEYLVRETTSITRRVLIVGASDGGSELVEELELHPDAPYVVVGVVDDERASDSIAGVPLLGRIDDLPEVIARERPDLVVLAVAQNRLEAFARLLSVATSGFKVLELPQFYEQAFGRVPVRRLTSAWFMSVLHLYQRPYTRFAKRTFDIIVATLGISLTAPLYPLVALLVKGTKGPLIFRQTRLGEGGKLFTIYKFRTMRNGAEEPGQPIWAEERDPRVTPLGRFLRRTRLDELPQLYNVVRGDMSIVGPRPERPEFVDLLESTVPFWTRRHLVKPGITGWAQVSCGYAADAEGTLEKLSYDLWYLRHRSLAVDLGICAKTVVALLSGSGAR
jgi:exopolysaccharide biosynthesis polyprenyl glycosylphosphotransferase